MDLPVVNRPQKFTHIFRQFVSEIPYLLICSPTLIRLHYFASSGEFFIITEMFGEKIYHKEKGKTNVLHGESYVPKMTLMLTAVVYRW